MVDTWEAVPYSNNYHFMSTHPWHREQQTVFMQSLRRTDHTKGLDVRMGGWRTSIITGNEWEKREDECEGKD